MLVNTATFASAMSWKTRKQANVKKWFHVQIAADVVSVAETVTLSFAET